jgi:hypothetical protein
MQFSGQLLPPLEVTVITFVDLAGWAAAIVWTVLWKVTSIACDGIQTPGHSSSRETKAAIRTYSAGLPKEL